MKVCAISEDALLLIDEVACVVDDPRLVNSDCSVLMGLLKKRKTHKDCEYYLDYTPPRELSEKELLKHIRQHLEQMPKPVLSTIYELIEKEVRR